MRKRKRNTRTLLKLHKEIINGARNLRPFTCPTNKDHAGAIGMIIEKKLISNVHGRNESDVHKLELKTKNIDSKSLISLAKYTNPVDTFNRTYKKVKDNLLLIYWKQVKDKIHLVRSELYSNLDKGDFATYTNFIRRKGEIDCRVSANNLIKLYKTKNTYEHSLIMECSTGTYVQHI